MILSGANLGNGALNTVRIAEGRGERAIVASQCQSHGDSANRTATTLGKRVLAPPMLCPDLG
jgi:hypothetical protein